MQKIIANAIKLCLVLIVVFSGVVSCTKSTTNPVTKSKTQYLTQAGWKLIKAELKTGAGPWVDQTSTISPCDLDDIALFNANGSYEQNEGATKCSPTDPQIIETGTWVFLSNETQIKTTATGSSSSDTGVIEQLDDTTFVFTDTNVAGGVTYYYRSTLKH